MRNLHLLTIVHTVKSKVKILQNFVAFSEYMKFTKKTLLFPQAIKNCIFLPYIKAKNSIIEWEKSERQGQAGRSACWPQAMMIGKTAMKQGPGLQLNTL